MEVEIIKEQKPAKKQMTVEELEEERFIGLKCEDRKYLLTVADGHYYFVATGSVPRSAGCENKQKAIELQAEKSVYRTFHFFETAKELYLWMAE